MTIFKYYSLSKAKKQICDDYFSKLLNAFHFVCLPRRSVTSVTFPLPPPRLHLDPETRPSSHVAFCHALTEMTIRFFAWRPNMSHQDISN